jgi:ABC-type nitrate/sulfonate/bicarbonate transport system permease component
MVSETYGKAKVYSSENPGKTILIALGIGIGLGLLLGASTHHRSTSSRFAQPVVHALTDIASELFR